MMKPGALLFLVLFCLVTPARSQWTKVADRLLGTFPASCCGFGHITYTDGKLWAGRSSLFVSPDTGRTWSKLKDFNGTISQIDFIDKFIGLVATTTGVFQTKDGGQTWQTILSSPDCYSAEFCGNSEIIVAISDNVGFFFSSNGGISWTRSEQGGHPHFTLGNSNGTAFAFTDRGSGDLMLTEDKGRSYISSGSLDGDSFFGARDSCGAIYVVNEGGHVDNDGLGAIYKSSNEGQSWDRIVTREIAYYSAGISVSRNAVFLQTTANGIERSTDQGTIWVNIKGPSNTVDTRTVCAIDDNLVFAVHSDGSIWRTINSGGDSVRIAPGITYRVSTPLSLINHVPNAEIAVPITVANATIGKAFNMIVHYDSVSYVYKGTLAANGDRIDVPSQSWPGRSFVAFRSSDIVADSGVIGSSVFSIKWHEPFCDIVRFDSAFAEGTACNEGINGTMTETIVGNYPGCSLIVTGTDENPGFLIRPNPSNGLFVVTGVEPKNVISLTVLDVLGNVIHEDRGPVSAEQTITINLEKESAGAYYVRINSGTTIETIKIVKY